MRITREMYKEIINKVPQWKKTLTERQVDILDRYLSGTSVKEIAELHELSTNRIRSILYGENKFKKKSIYKKIQGEYSSMLRRLKEEQEDIVKIIELD